MKEDLTKKIGENVLPFFPNWRKLQRKFRKQEGRGNTRPRSRRLWKG